GSRAIFRRVVGSRRKALIRLVGEVQAAVERNVGRGEAPAEGEGETLGPGATGADRLPPG
ncbi:MAG: hypothetical protein D6701_07190, partial [Gemmatimonadetes bacterium]